MGDLRWHAQYAKLYGTGALNQPDENLIFFSLSQAKANPELAAANKASADAKRERRKESGSTKVFQ